MNLKFRIYGTVLYKFVHCMLYKTINVQYQVQTIHFTSTVQLIFPEKVPSLQVI